MSHLDEIATRKQKIEVLTRLGIPVHPATFAKKQTIGELQKEEDASFRTPEILLESPKKIYSTAGRLVLFRSFGKLAFGQLQDDSGRIQILFSKGISKIHIEGEDTLEKDEYSAFKILEKLIDLGDFLGIEGELFYTHKGERTLFATSFQFLGKALRPLPEKYHGLADEEVRYRQRYLDLITDETSMDRFKFRSDCIRVIREFYWKEGFREIEGQTLGNAATGAAAKPYITHQNALDMDVYLRISHEIPLKLMNIAGMDRIFELGKAFRNEGMDPSHLPEHTHLEHNVCYWTFEDNMRFTEKMFDYIFDTLKLERKRMIRNKQDELVEVDFTTPWKRIDYIEMVKEDTGIDVSIYTDVQALRADIRAQGIEIEGMDQMGLTTLIDYLYKKKSRPKIINPTFLYNYPVVLKPFARRNDKNPNNADAFQMVVNGWELINSYSELVDSLDQAERFAEGEKACAEGDEEAMTGDAEFITAMEYGMPPISGWGMGIDRLISLLTEQNNLRDVILFPLLRPETVQENGKK